MRERDWVKKFDEVREKIAEQQIYTDKVKSEVEKKLLQVCSHQFYEYKLKKKIFMFISLYKNKKVYKLSNTDTKFLLCLESCMF